MAKSVHLLELGLSWPPDTIIGRRMRGLASRGFRITAAATMRPDHDGTFSAPAEVAVVAAARSDASRMAKLGAMIRHGIPLALRSPARFRALIRACRASAVANGGGWLTAAWLLHLCIPLARLDPDVVHIDFEGAAVNYRPLLDVWDRPVVISCHGAGVIRYPHGTDGDRRRRELRRAFARADAVHCVADAVAAKAIELGAPPERIRVIRSAADPGFFSPKPGEDGKARQGAPESPNGEPSSTPFRLVGVGHLKATKGYEYGLLAVAALRDAGVPVRFEIIGSEPTSGKGLPSELPRLRRAIDDLELTDHVLIRGGVPPVEVRNALRDADALLHPSLSEGLPTAVVEAMSCGLPVVVTDVVGTRELVDDGIEGFLVEPRDPGGLAAAAGRLWREPALRRRMGQAARERVLREFDLEDRLDDFARLFTEITSGRDPSSGP